MFEFWVYTFAPRRTGASSRNIGKISFLPSEIVMEEKLPSSYVHILLGLSSCSVRVMFWLSPVFLARRCTRIPELNKNLSLLECVHEMMKGSLPWQFHLVRNLSLPTFRLDAPVLLRANVYTQNSKTTKVCLLNFTSLWDGWTALNYKGWAATSHSFFPDYIKHSFFKQAEMFFQSQISNKIKVNLLSHTSVRFESGNR